MSEYAEEIFEFCSHDLSKEGLIKALRWHFSKVYNTESERFGLRLSKSEDFKRFLEDKEKTAILKLGYHAGSISKTFFDNELRPLPKTTWVLEGKPMGWCLLEVID